MKTFFMPPHQRKTWEQEPYEGYEIRTIPISDIPLRSNENLQSYHQDIWGPDANDYRMDKSMVEEWGPYEYMRAVKDKNGNIRMADGNHRLKALANSGYEAVEMPFRDESAKTENEQASDLFGRKLK